MAVCLSIGGNCSIPLVNCPLRSLPILMQYFVDLLFRSWKCTQWHNINANVEINIFGKLAFKSLGVVFHRLEPDTFHISTEIERWTCCNCNTYVVLAVENKCGGRRWLGDSWWWSAPFAVVALSTLMLIFCMPLNLLSLLFCCPSFLLLFVDFTCVLLIFFA